MTPDYYIRCGNIFEKKNMYNTLCYIRISTCFSRPSVTANLIASPSLTTWLISSYVLGEVLDLWEQKCLDEKHFLVILVQQSFVRIFCLQIPLAVTLSGMQTHNRTSVTTAECIKCMTQTSSKVYSNRKLIKFSCVLHLLT